MAIRKASRNYNSDWMSRQMDDRLDDLEDRLTALYANAYNDIASEFDDFTSSFEEADKRMRARYLEGEITKEEYTNWRRKELLKAKGYKLTLAEITDVLVNTDVAAMALVAGELPSVIAESYNFMASLGWAAADEAGLSVGTFQIYNARTVQALIKDNPDLLPSIDIPEDLKWNKDRINREITQGIIQGDSMPEIADRLRQVTTMDENAAIRNARTSMTYAENLGRDNAYNDMKDKGMPVAKKWSATMDDRTRATHRQLNGTYANEEGYFGEGILETLLKCPGDPRGDAQEIYNCRCRESVVFQKGIVDHSQDDAIYEQFMKKNYPDDYEALKQKGQI